MKTVILDDWEYAISKIAQLDRLKQFSEVMVYHDHPSKETIKERLKDADAVILLRERTKLTRELLDNMKKIKLIAQTGTGIAHIDMDEVNRRGIPVAITPGGSTAAVTELTFAFMLCLNRDLFHLSQEMKQGSWPLSIGRNLVNKTLGIIGLGKIGSSVARLADAFGMKVVAWGPRLTKDRAEKQGVTYVSLEQLLRQSHFVSLHVRLVPETEELLKKEHFEMMRNDAFLINTSRGKVVDESALIWALKNKQIKGAGLDVFVNEPMDSNHPLLKLRNVILSPHIGWKTEETFEKFLNGSIDNIESYFKFGKPANITNEEVLAYKPNNGKNI